MLRMTQVNSDYYELEAITIPAYFVAAGSVAPLESGSSIHACWIDVYVIALCGGSGAGDICAASGQKADNMGR